MQTTKMGSIGETHMTPTQGSDEEANLFAMQLASASVLPMVLKSAIELDLLEIIAKAAPGACLSPSEIASQLPIRNPDATVIVDSTLLRLARYSILTYSLRTLPDGRIERLYGTGPGVSIAPPCLKNQNKFLMESCKFASEQEINAFIRSHAIFKFLNPLLLALLQVHFQVQEMSPFQTHPAYAWGFLAATCFYCLGLGLEMHIKSRCEILEDVLLISGAFSSASLVSIFLPRSLGWLPFIIWAILSFTAGRPLLMRVYRRLHQEIPKVILQVRNFFGRFMGSATVQQQRLPI